MDGALVAEELTKRYGERAALRGVSFVAAPGELLAVIGPNGAGKTTLLSILAGIQAPTSGTVQAPGAIGWVPQQPAVYSKLSVVENLRLFARLERVGDVDAVVAAMLEQTGLGDRADEELSRLSGGNRQRVNIAVGLLAAPPVLLLDEPSTALDPRQRVRLWEFVGSLAQAGTTVVYSTHHVPEAEHHADRVLVLAEGEGLFLGTAADLHAEVGGARDFEAAFVEFLGARGPLMRWLLVKDLQILRRSPLLVALLVIYPIALALLIGFALSSPPAKPKVAFLNEVPAGATKLSVGGQSVDAKQYTNRLKEAVDLVPVDSRQEAEDKVRSGEALAAIIIPSDVVEKLESELKEGLGKPSIDVILNTSDPLESEFVDATIKARFQDLQAALSKEVLKVATNDLDVVLNGGSIDILGQNVDLLGLKRSRDQLDRLARTLPESSPRRQQLEDVVSFADVAVQGLGFASPVLGAIGSPLKINRTSVTGNTTPADAFAVAIAVTVSLMFVALLLAAGMLALEREEHAYGRLVRGLVSRTGLLAEKAVLAGVCAGAVALIMALGIAVFGSLQIHRLPLWIVGVFVAGASFGALGVALGALAREVRAASLMAIGLSLPIAFLALVPASAVSGTLKDVLDVVSAIFPFKPSLDAVNAALNGATTPSFGGAVAHCAILAVAYGALARLAVRRF